MEPDADDDILGAKKLNYDFLQKIREKKYGQAYIIGRQILKANPNNPSIIKFMQFIEKNARKLDEMIKDQEEYESVHSSDSSDEEAEEVEGSSSSGEYESGEQEDEQATKAEQQEVNGKQQSSSSEESDKDSKQEEEEEEEEQPPKPEKKVELTTCTLNQIPHVCPRHHKLIMEAKAQGKV